MIYDRYTTKVSKQKAIIISEMIPGVEQSLNAETKTFAGKKIFIVQKVTRKTN